jgi:hypothetical protein
MAKASKYNRARIRSRVRRPKKRGASSMWTAMTAVIVVVGVVLVVFTVADRKTTADARPKIGDHWHAYLGINVCGEWIAPAPQFEQRADQAGVQAGLHSHGDGLLHFHPFASDESGDKATLGRFMAYGGWDLSDSSMTLWDNQTHKNGDECGTGADAKPAELQWTVGHYGKKWTGTPRSGDPADYKPKNGDIVAIYMVPKGEKLTEPPDATTALANIQDLGGAPVKSGPVPGGVTGGTGSTGSTGGTGSTGSTGDTGTTGTTPTSTP